jgi:hypothetical protein
VCLNEWAGTIALFVPPLPADYFLIYIRQVVSSLVKRPALIGTRKLSTSAA